ncbi:Uncharacterised protein [Mycobacteroides abscessus]|nr:Uncharacterised protein [Mycobacteroides abscessus]
MKTRAWSGPTASLEYDGALSPAAAAASWSDVFQSSPAPRPAAADSVGSTSPSTSPRAGSRPWLR